MKKLLLTFSLLLLLTVQSNANLPSKLMTIVENGWDDENETLHDDSIEKDYQLINEIHKDILRPLVETMQANLTTTISSRRSKKDYLKLFAYVKYLENEGKLEESEKIYSDFFKGISTIEPKSFSHVFRKIQMEKVVLKSLKESLNHTYYNKKRENFKKLVSSIFVDKKFLIETLKSEYESRYNLITDNFGKNANEKMQEVMFDRVLYFVRRDLNEQEDILTKAINSNSFKEAELFEKENEKKLQELPRKLKKAKLKSKFLPTGNIDEQAELIAQLIDLSYFPLIMNSSEKALKHTEKTKQFLEKI